LKYLKPLLATSLIIAIIFVIASLFDIILIFLYPRFYSTAAFIVTFAVGGIFAGTIGYIYGMERFVEKKKTAKWLLISFSILTGLFFSFPLPNWKEVNTKLRSKRLALCLLYLLYFL
jgi:hypothetical protein